MEASKGPDLVGSSMWPESKSIVDMNTGGSYLQPVSQSFIHPVRWYTEPMMGVGFAVRGDMIMGSKVLPDVYDCLRNLCSQDGMFRRRNSSDAQLIILL